MRGVEPLHQSGRAIIVYIPQTRNHSRNAGDQEGLRQTAKGLVAPLVAKPCTTTRENDQSRSLRLQVVDLLGMKRAVAGDPVGIFQLRGSGVTLFGQHDRGEHRGLLIAQRVRGQMDDLVFANLFGEDAFGGLPSGEDQAMRVEGLDAFKLLLRGGQGLEFGETLLIEARVAEAEKRLRFALLFAKGEVDGARKHTRARVDDEREILDQIALRFRRDQRGERQILQHAVRRDAEREVPIETLAYRRDQQLIKFGRLVVELIEWRARPKRF